ncbi:MAG: hypothetical protein IPG34_06970 [Rhodocyclaceae bacterium]|nr:hypothetical protein [Rhodocyclaceae bacterium]
MATKASKGRRKSSRLSWENFAAVAAIATDQLIDNPIGLLIDQVNAMLAVSLPEYESDEAPHRRSGDHQPRSG